MTYFVSLSCDVNKSKDIYKPYIEMILPLHNMPVFIAIHIINILCS